MYRHAATCIEKGTGTDTGRDIDADTDTGTDIDTNADTVIVTQIHRETQT